MIAGVLRPFGGIEIAEIDDTPAQTGNVQILGHRPGKYDGLTDPLPRHDLPDPLGQRRTPVIRQTQRLAGEQPTQAAEACAARREPHYVRLFTPFR